MVNVDPHLVDEDPAVVVAGGGCEEVDVEGGAGVALARVGAGGPPVVPGVHGAAELAAGLHHHPHHARPARGRHRGREHGLHPGTSIFVLGSLAPHPNYSHQQLEIKYSKYPDVDISNTKLIAKLRLSKNIVVDD